MWMVVGKQEIAPRCQVQCRLKLTCIRTLMSKLASAMIVNTLEN